MWSFGLGWNLHKEKFLENVEWIDVIRLKWSWGYNGQTTGSPYQAITTYKYSNSNITTPAWEPCRSAWATPS